MNWGTMSRDERDAAYNNTDAVKNSAELNAAREAASAVFRKAHPEHLDLPYGPRERNKWDLFPAQDPNAPCLVFIHGGYWQRNSRDMFASLIAGPLRPWLGGGAAGLHAGARRLAHRDRGRDQRGARLAGGQRTGAWHQRQGRAVGLVGRRPSDGAVPRPSAGQRRARHLRRVRAGPIRDTYLNEKLQPQRRRDRAPVAAAPADGAASRSPSPTARPSCRRWSATAGHCMRCGRRSTCRGR